MSNLKFSKGPPFQYGGSREDQNGYHIQNGGLKYNIKTLVILTRLCFKNVASNFKIDCKSGNKLNLVK